MKTLSIVLSIALLLVFAIPAMGADDLSSLFGPKVDWQEKYIQQVDKNVLLDKQMDEAMADLDYQKAKRNEFYKFAGAVLLAFIYHDMHRGGGSDGGTDGGTDCPSPPKPPKPPKNPPCR